LLKQRTPLTEVKPLESHVFITFKWLESGSCANVNGISDFIKKILIYDIGLNTIYEKKIKFLQVGVTLKNNNK